MAEQTKAAIIEAAREIFVEKGYAGARMQEIADAAGINKALLHYHFKSKEQLFQMILTETLGLVIPKLADAIDGEGSVMDKIEVIVHAYIDVLREHPHVPLFVLHELSQKREDFIGVLKQRMARIPNFQIFFQQMMEEMAAGKIRQIPPLQLVLNVISLSVFPFIARPIFCNVMEVSAPDFDELMAQRADEVVDFIRHAISV